jgi:hypothetical protein
MTKNIYRRRIAGKKAADVPYDPARFLASTAIGIAQGTAGNAFRGNDDLSLHYVTSI